MSDKPKVKWQGVQHGDDYLVEIATARIIGDVHRLTLTPGPEWSTIFRLPIHHSLGQYTTEAAAKRAVELAYAAAKKVMRKKEPHA